MSTETRSNLTADRLRALVSRRSGNELFDIDPSQPIQDIGLDSLSLAELLFDIDDEFGIEVTNDHIMEIKQVGELVQLIENLVAAKNTAS
jgi:acyl carrier protein